MEIQLERELSRTLQLGEDLVVTHGEFGHRRHGEYPRKVRSRAAVLDLDMGGDRAFPLDEEDGFGDLVHGDGGAKEAAAGAGYWDTEREGAERGK